MTTFQPFEAAQVSSGCYALTDEQAAQLFTPEQIAAGEVRFDIRTFGPWHTVVSVRGLCVWLDHDANSYTNRQPLHVYGIRTLTNRKQTGFEGEGRVSVAGKRRRAFSSSVLFQLSGNRLLSVAVLHLGKERAK